jgi:NB-ARC domain
MTFEDALRIIRAALAPNCLSELQEQVFQRSWYNHSYVKIALNINHRESYIKDVGSELWQLLSQKLETKVTKLNLREAVMQYVQLQQTPARPALPQIHVDWGEAPDVSQLCGRAVQLTKLEQWVMQERCRMVAIVGMGGVGKTILATQLAQQLVDTEQFEVVVWRSLRQAPPLQELLTDLMSAIAPLQSLPQRLDAIMRQLQEQLRHRRCLLILDNVEAVLQGKELVGTYRPGYEDYGWLFQQLGEGRHQSSVLLTSREIIPQVSIQAGSRAAVRLWRLEPLSVEEGKSILAAKGLNVQTEQTQQVKELIKRYQGNPLALKIVATLIEELFDGNITAFLAQNTLLFKDICDLLAPQFARLSLLERQVMNWLAREPEAVTTAQLQVNLLPSMTPAQLQDTLASLDRRSLIEKNEQNLAPTLINSGNVSYTQQAMVREYVTSQLAEQMCQKVEQVPVDCLKNHSLLEVQAKDYIKNVQPTLAKLSKVLESKKSLKILQLELLRFQQTQAPLQRGCFDRNAIYLLRQLGMDLSYLDFSNLMIWQADLRMVNPNETNFGYEDLSYSVFTQSKLVDI